MGRLSIMAAPGGLLKPPGRFALAMGAGGSLKKSGTAPLSREFYSSSKSLSNVASESAGNWRVRLRPNYDLGTLI
jgi:hypothetical protein